MKRALTLFTDFLYSGDQLFLQVLAVLGNLLALFQEVLRGLLDRHGQDVGLLRATLLLTGRSFVTGVHQSGHLWDEPRLQVKTTNTRPFPKLNDIKSIPLAHALH